MDKRSSVLQLLLLLALWQAALGIVGRDLVLTPRQGLQLSGRNIYYEDEPLRATANERPWERTLKHVTYVTLFSNSSPSGSSSTSRSNGTQGVTLNASQASQLQQRHQHHLPPTYNEFMRAPYVNAVWQQDTRFGDIVTLAQGRLEMNAAGAYRFIENERCGDNGNGNNHNNNDNGNANDNCIMWPHVRALWQVQKIRHRDAHKKFRYEIKYSVSPLGYEVGERSGGMQLPVVPTLQFGDQRGRRTYLQKAEDYPQSFNHASTAPAEAPATATATMSMADRRLDAMYGRGGAGNVSRNFRQVPARQRPEYSQVTPMPQSTFMHSIFQPPPPPPPAPTPPPQPLQSPVRAALNRGEYANAYGVALLPKPPTAKIELYPNIFHLMQSDGAGISGAHQPTPTTYRPHYMIKLPRPDLYAPPPPPPPPPPASAAVVTSQQKSQMPHVTHHYHHHFYMPGSDEQAALNANGVDGVFVKQRDKLSPSLLAHYPGTASGGGANLYDDEDVLQHNVLHVTTVATPTASQQVLFPSAYGRLPERVVQVTPVPPMPLKKPHIYRVQPMRAEHSDGTIGGGGGGGGGNNNRLLIYPAMNDAETETDDDANRDVGDVQGHYATPTPVQPFLQSEPYNDVPIRYSEPDPLYLTVSSVTDDDTPQLYEAAETPKSIGKYEVVVAAAPATAPGAVQKKPDSINTQLPAPAVGQDVRIPYVDEAQVEHNQAVTQYTEEQSEEQDERDGDDEAEVLVRSTTTSLTDKRQIQHKPTTKTTTTATAPTGTSVGHTPAQTTLSKSVSSSSSSSSSSSAHVKRDNFVSTSTTQKPLRTVSRQHTRNGTHTHNPNSTEKSTHKWKPKSRHRRPIKTFGKTTSTRATAGSLVEKAKAIGTTTTTASTVATTSAPTNDNEVYEVLTQKSVSKSVSIKVGSNGEEIPIIVEDSANGDDDDNGDNSDSESQSVEEQANFVTQKNI